MTLGDALLVGAVLAAIVALAWPKRALLATRIHVALVLAALAWMITDLLAGTLIHEYAWAHSRTDYPILYRLAGLWGGEEGTILLWAAVVATALLVIARRPAPLHQRAARLLLSFSGALSLIAFMLGAFDATRPGSLAQAPFGRGLADVLLTPLMVIHPPIQFVAYGLLAVPAAYALASLWEPEHDGTWAGLAFPWARRAWLFATLGLTLGALWAYYVLSFGGYWAWDPVETSNLLPWLAATAFLHAGKQRQRAQGHETSSFLLSTGAFALTLFATFATRSGLWVSVHAFTDPTDRFEPDAAARLLAIVDVHEPTRLFLGVLSAILFGVVGLYTARRLGQRLWGAALVALAGAALLSPATLWGALLWLATRATPLALGLGVLLALLLGAPFAYAFLRDDDTRAKLKLDNRTLLAASVVLLSVSLGVVFLLNLQVVNGPDRSVFDARVPFLALPIASLLTIMLALAPLGRTRALALAGIALVLSLGAFLYWRSVFALAAPVCAAAALAAVLKLAHVQGASAPPRLRLAGALTLVASLLGLLMWSNPPTRVGDATLPDGASLALGLAGVALATLALMGSVAMFRARGRGVAIGGAIAATLAAGYAIGAILGIAALYLLSRERFADGFWQRERPRIRETGIYLVHLAVAIGLIGFAASTYAQEREVFANEPIGAIVHVAGHEIIVGDPIATASARGLETVAVPLELSRAGVGDGSESLRFEWREASGVYTGLLDVRRSLHEDVYVSPLAFHTPQGWVGADSAAGARVAPAQVDAVTFSVSVLPLMSFVWAAGWMMVIGMGFVILGARAAPIGADRDGATAR